MMRKKVRTLLRVSSRQQLHDDDIPMQRAEARQYINKRSDWVFDKEYIEKAVSAYKNGVEDREVLQEILADAKEKQFQVLLTYMSDRIGRQEEYSFYVATLNQLGIEVWTIKDGQLKTEEHIDKLLNYIRFWQNEGESKKTGMRVKDTQREMVKEGKFVGGKAPFGYRLVPSGMVSNHGRLLKKLEIVEENAGTVRKIYDLAVQHGMGYERIAKELNRQGIPAVSAEQWKAGSIRSILMNPVYMGYLAIGRRVNQGSLMRVDRKDWVYSEKQIQELVIVSPQIWERAQEIREARKARINVSKERTAALREEHCQVPFRTGGRLLLLGLIYCGYCGRRLRNGSYYNHWTTKAGEKKTAFTGRYVCSKRCGGRSAYPQNDLEHIVFEAAETYLERFCEINMAKELRKRQDRKREAAEREQKAIAREYAAIKQDIDTLEDKIPAAIRGDYYFSVEKLASIVEEKKQLLGELAEKEKHRKRQLEEFMQEQRVMEQQEAIVVDWKTEFHNAEDEVKKMLLSCLIEKIQVKERSVHVVFKIGVVI